jgi:ElaB/YqjD/DUF883 family membrane-anchored ribosome-binding protein
MEGLMQSEYQSPDSARLRESAQDMLREEVAQLRIQLQQLVAQVEELMLDRVAPAAADIADRAEDAVLQVRDFTRAKFEAVSDDVRERPLAALLVAAAVGYFVARITR